MQLGQAERLQTTSKAAGEVIDAKAAGYNVLGNPRPAVIAYVVQHEINELSVIGGPGAHSPEEAKKRSRICAGANKKTVTTVRGEVTLQTLQS